MTNPPGGGWQGDGWPEEHSDRRPPSAPRQRSRRPPDDRRRREPAPYDQGAYDQGHYDQGGYDPYRQGGYEQPGYDPQHQQGYYQQGGYEQGAYEPYQQGGYDQGHYDQGHYDQGHYDQAGYDQAAYAMPDWRDPTDPRGQGVVRAPRGRGGGGLPPRVPTIPTLLAAVVAVVLAFVLGRSMGGGGGDSEVATPVTTDSVSTTVAQPTTHVVGTGETLSSIAASYGLTTDELAAYNGITNVNHVFIGQRLNIPPATTPTVATTTTKAKSKDSG